jgi:hypothetical protein
MLFIRCINRDGKKWSSELIGVLEHTKHFPILSNYTWNFEIIVTPENDYWIIGNVGNFKFSHSEKKFLPVTETPRKITDRNLNSAFSRSENLNPKVKDAKVNSILKPIFVETYCIDNQNILWQGFLSSGSVETGLTRTIKTPGGFKHYFTELNPEAGLNAFFPVLKNKYGTIWGGAANVNTIFQYEKNGTIKRVAPLDSETFKISQRVRSFLEDSTGIWIGYFQKLLLRYDFKSNKFSKIILKESDSEDRSLPQSFVHLKKVGDDLLIFGFKEIFNYNALNNSLTKVLTYDINSNFNIYSVTNDNETGWWLGCNVSRLIHFDKNFREIATYKIGNASFNIEDIIIGDNNDLWLSLLGGGLAHFDKTTGKTIKVYTTADGLSNNTCYGMLKDKKGNLWISTNKGISKFNPKTEQFRIFGKMEGLEIEEFNSDNTFLAPDGEMFFAGMGGVVSFYPDSIIDESISAYSPPLLITGMRVSGSNRYFGKAVYECDTVRLEKGDDNFRITFACLDFVNAEKIRYRYRLVGENDEFAETDHRNRSVNFSNLKPGNYRFEVESTDMNGDWNSKTALVILIPSIFYKTFWFDVIVVIFFISLTVYIIYSYFRRLRIKALYLQSELKLESLRSQMNPHFIFNSLNSINYFISQNDRLSANRYIADFSGLIRSFLGNLSHEFIPLSKELESLKGYLQLEHLRFGDRFDYELIIAPEIQPDEIFVFPGIVQPFIENAVWHGVRGLEGRKGFIRIVFYVEGEGIKVIVEDDGIGRKLAGQQKHQMTGKTSKGIGIVLERLKIANYLYKKHYQVLFSDLKPDSAETGTRVIIDIPLKMSR